MDVATGSDYQPIIVESLASCGLHTAFILVDFDDVRGHHFAGDDVVLDKETGLIWPRDANIFGTDEEWQSAITSCHNLSLGDRKGWRLATIEELTSLFDTSEYSPVLPSGHPFINVQSSYYSSTTYDFDTTRAYSVAMSNGNVGSSPKASWPNMFVWPVRGGNGYAIRD